MVEADGNSCHLLPLSNYHSDRYVLLLRISTLLRHSTFFFTFLSPGILRSLLCLIYWGKIWEAR